MTRSILLAVSFSLIITCAKAQTYNTGNTGINDYLQKLKNIDHCIQQQDWNAASKQWQDIISLNPVDGEMWYRYGESLYLNGEPRKAIDAFQNAMRIGTLPFSAADCAYYISKCHAKKREEAKALDWLQQSFDLGYRNLSVPPGDSAFLPYFNNDRFKQIVGIPLHEFKTREEGWRFDLQLLAREIKRRRVDPYKSISKEQLDSVIDTLDKKIPSLTDLQVILELMKIMKLVGDGHTLIYGFYERPEFLENLPFNMNFFKEGLYITEADIRHRDLLGCEILALDDKSISEIMKGLDPIINRDNEIAPRIMGLFRMRTLPLLYGLGLIKNTDEVTITVKDPFGKTRKLKVAGDCPVPTRRLWDRLPDSWISYHTAKNISVPNYLKNPFQPYWFEYLQDQQVLYFQYNRVSSEGIPFNHFCDSLFDFIKSHEVDKLVIDLRLNAGGNTRLVPYLLNKIIAATQLNRIGHLFVITGSSAGSRTFSAAQNFATFLNKFTQAVFIGEPTGSSPNFIGEDNPFELPYSKLMANVSDLYWQSSWPTDSRQWIAPFFYIEPSFKDFAAGKDPALDAILSFRAPDK